jgi:hypothetical protein
MVPFAQVSGFALIEEFLANAPHGRPKPSRCAGSGTALEQIRDLTLARAVGISNGTLPEVQSRLIVADLRVLVLLITGGPIS